MRDAATANFTVNNIQLNACRVGHSFLELAGAKENDKMMK